MCMDCFHYDVTRTKVSCSRSKELSKMSDNCREDHGTLFTKATRSLYEFSTTAVYSGVYCGYVLK